jgi:hypothetical protein
VAEIRTAAGGRGGARAAAALLLLSLAATAAFTANAQEATDRRLDRVLTQTPLIDGHNDLPWELRERFGGDLAKIDLPRAQRSSHSMDGEARGALAHSASLLAGTDGAI